MSDALDRRLTALRAAAELAHGRVEPARVAAAEAVVRRAGERLGLGLEATVVALAGPTGAGKSTLFNGLAGGELVPAGARRPTTARPTAAIWGQTPGPLLDWLEVPTRHPVAAGEVDGLVLLDLPDFDSVEADHRLEVDRVIRLVDLLVWVVDPQKYADAALHEHYLRPLAAYGASMLVVLNQADRLSGDGVAACQADLRALLGRDGLGEVPVLAVSGRTGAGMARLSHALAQRVARREAALARLAADVEGAASGLGEPCGDVPGGTVGRRERQALVASLSAAAGAPAVVSAVEAAHRRRGALAAGWPFVRWVRRARPDPLRRLGLRDQLPEPGAEDRTSLPGPTPVQRSQAGSAIRSLAGGLAGDVGGHWPAVVRGAATRHEEELPAALDRAVAGADLGMRAPRWWRAAGALQLVLAAVAVAGLLWLLALAALGWLRLEDLIPVPEVAGFPVPTALLLGGLVLGLVLALVTRAVNRASARRRARVARRRLHERIDAVAGELVVDPVSAELDAYRRLCDEVAVALG